MSKVRLVITAAIVEGRSQDDAARAYGVSRDGSAGWWRATGCARPRRIELVDPHMIGTSDVDAIGADTDRQSHLLWAGKASALGSRDSWPCRPRRQRSNLVTGMKRCWRRAVSA
jgi:hypothetical protein